MSPPGKNTRLHDVRVGGDDQPAVADAAAPRRRPSRPAPNAVHRERRRSRGEQRLRISARIARPPAPCFMTIVGSRRPECARTAASLTTLAHQFRVPAVLVPDPAGALAAHHARAHRRVGHALLAEQRAVVGRRDAGHDVAADAVLRAAPAARASHSALEVDREPAPRVERARTRRAGAGCRWGRGRCRASAARGSEHRATAAPAPAVALAGHAAREAVHHLAAPVADQLDELDQPGQDVERLEAGDHHRNPVALDERLEDRPSR